MSREANNRAHAIALSLGIRLCPCGKVWELCAEHAKGKPVERPKPYSHKVTDPKSGFYPGSKAHEEWKRTKREEMRRNPTPAERILLGYLTDPEWIFQPIVMGFIPDFAHEKARIIVEVDGSVHNTTAGKRRDARRDNIFRINRWCVLRFSNIQVERQTEDVLRVINAQLHARLDGNGSGRA